MKCCTPSLVQFTDLILDVTLYSSILCFSPTIGEDFLSDLDLRTVQCIVGGALTRSPNHVLGMGSVERLRLNDSQIRLIREVFMYSGRWNLQIVDTLKSGPVEVGDSSFFAEDDNFRTMAFVSYGNSQACAKIMTV